MRKPTSFDYDKVDAWLDYHRSSWAFDRMVGDPPHDRWRMVQVMIAYAPDAGILGYVAAGPVEDLMSGEFLPLMQQEAVNNRRFRIALGMTHGLAKELEPFAEQKAEGAELPPIQPIALIADEVALMVAYFHQRDTIWADSLFHEMNRTNPAEALFMLQMLLDRAEKTPDLLDAVFVHAVNTFLRKHFSTYRSELTAMAQRHDALRNWFIKTEDPCVSDLEGWAGLIRDLNP